MKRNQIKTKNHVYKSEIPEVEFNIIQGKWPGAYRISFMINKCQDEWFYIYERDFSKMNTEKDTSTYKCDQWEGLVQFLEDKKFEVWGKGKLIDETHKTI